MSSVSQKEKPTSLKWLLETPDFSEKICRHLRFADFRRLHEVSTGVFKSLSAQFLWGEKAKMDFGKYVPAIKNLPPRAVYLYLHSQLLCKERIRSGKLSCFVENNRVIRIPISTGLVRKALNKIPLLNRLSRPPLPMNQRVVIASISELAEGFCKAPSPYLARILDRFFQRHDFTSPSINQGGEIVIESPEKKVWKASIEAVVAGREAVVGRRLVCLQIISENSCVARLMRTKANGKEERVWTPISSGRPDFPLEMYLANSLGLKQWSQRLLMIQFAAKAYLPPLDRTSVHRNGWRVSDTLSLFELIRRTT